MKDDMYFSRDERSLVRGKRTAKRTETCRPCLIRIIDEDVPDIEGVVLDVTPFGMMIRMIDTISIGTKIMIQLMRDDSFQIPLSKPIEAEVRRHDSGSPGFTDHGMKMSVKDIPREKGRPAAMIERPKVKPRKRQRMHTIDFTVGGDASPRGRR